MKNLLSKKGQVQVIAPAVLALVFAAIVLVFGLIISQSMRDIPIITQGVNSNLVNESANFGASAETSVTLVANGFPAGACGAVTSVRNGSLGILIVGTDNFTQSGCVITNTSNTFATDDWLIDYPYTAGGGAYKAANETIAGLGTFADFWEIIVLAIIISIVIGLLLVVFGGSNRR